MRLSASMQTKVDVVSREPREILKALRSWHRECAKEKACWMAIVCRSDHPANVLVGLGHAKGIFVWFNYRSASEMFWESDLYSVATRSRRRSVIEFNYEGNPYDIPTQCLLPEKAALSAVEFFLKTSGVSMRVSWVSNLDALRPRKRRRV
jgi:hypothetical protein